MIDFGKNPCDDFYTFSCGAWINNTKLPPSDPVLIKGITFIEENDQLISKSILEQPSHPKLNDFFDSCEDTETIDSKGFEPLAPLWNYIDMYTGQNNKSLTQMVGVLTSKGLSPFFGFGSVIDAGSPMVMVAEFSQGGLFLGDISLYNDPTIMKQYLAHATKMFQLVNVTNPEGMAEAAITVEKMISGFTTPADKLTNPFTTYNKLTYDQFQKLTPDLDWEGFFFELSIDLSDVQNITVDVPNFFSNMTSLIGSLQPSQVVAYLRWSLLTTYSSYLSKPFRDEHFHFFSTILDGQTTPSARWRECVGETDSALGELLGKFWVEKAFPGSSQSDAVALLKGIIGAMKADLQAITWMDSVTQSLSLQKLSKVSDQIGSPAHPDDYSDLTISSTEFFSNVLHSRERALRNNFLTVGQKKQLNTWEMTPSTVNAYYDPTKNQMVFPAGILQGPYFNHTFPTEMQAARVIMGHELTHGFDNQGRLYDGDGKLEDSTNLQVFHHHHTNGLDYQIHELTHGFDNQGRLYDGDGKLEDWWNPETGKKFDAKVQCVIDQYSKFSPLPGVYVNGELTQGENIADMGGTKNAYNAVKTLLGGDQMNAPSIVPNFNRGQLFFVAYAQTWCEKASDQYIKRQVKTDPHSPAKFRVIGPLTNLPAFADTFKCPVGSPMNPEKRCEVW